MLSLFTESIPLVPTAISVQWITYAEMRSLKRETIMAKGSVLGNCETSSKSFEPDLQEVDVDNKSFKT